MMSRFLRHFCRLCWWIFICIFSLMINWWAVVEHYLGAKNALELAGTERQELAHDGLMGSMFSAFIPTATLPMAMALTLSCMEAMAFLIISYLLIELVSLFHHRREMVNAQDAAELSAANWSIMKDIIFVTIITLLLIPAIRWDLALFQFRSLAAAGAIEDPAIAARMASWTEAFKSRGHEAGVALAQIGAWGYMAFTMLGCMGLEFSFEKLGNETRFLLDPIEAWWKSIRKPAENQESFYGYDANGQPVYDPSIPLAYDAEGNALEEATSGAERAQDACGGIQDFEHPLHATDEQPEQDSSGLSEDLEAGRETSQPQPPSRQEGNLVADNPTDPHNAENTVGQPLFNLPPEPQTPAASPHVTAPVQAFGSRGDQHAVIGGESGEGMSLAAALADPDRYYVDTPTGRIWDRAYWEQLHNPNTTSKGEEAA
jgi:hypothetical protein